jgi:triosephosphate isomerase
MDKAKRQTIIAGNWKMNKTPSETAALIREMKDTITTADCGVVLCVPAVCIPSALEAAKGSLIKIGAQNVHFEQNGAYTGEISCSMLVDLGIEYVIIGHSERRQYFGETDITVNKRAVAALEAGLIPIICVGETLEQRELGITKELVSMQVKIALCGVSPEKMARVILAYEPVWAIGTGKTATADQADEVNGWVREAVCDLYGQAIADATTIQYGGSMNAANAKELLAKHHVDGGLIGGASLKAADFAVIVDAAK